MTDNQLSLPGAFGGLIRYNEEYESRFKFKPAHVIAVIILFAVAIIILNVFKV
jgi:preprotein translocase subunit Sec61beta